MKLLVIDDDPSLRRAIAESVSDHWPDCQVMTEKDGESGLQRFFHELPDALVLDIGLPGMSGLKVLEVIREASAVPILILSGQGGEADVVRALDLGADEYVTKPCGYHELAARLKALMRRTEPAPRLDASEMFVADGLAIHFPSHQVHVDGRSVALTNTEYRLLYYLVRNAGRIVSHTALLKQAWGSEIYGRDVVRVYVSRLRSKIEPDRLQPRYILTKPGMGYLFGVTKEQLDDDGYADEDLCPESEQEEEEDSTIEQVVAA